MVYIKIMLYLSTGDPNQAVIVAFLPFLNRYIV